MQNEKQAGQPSTQPIANPLEESTTSTTAPHNTTPQIASPQQPTDPYAPSNIQVANPTSVYSTPTNREQYGTVVRSNIQNAGGVNVLSVEQPKPKKHRKWVFIVIGLIVLLGLGSYIAVRVNRNYKAITYGTNTSGSKQYTDPLGFKITPPQGWGKVVNCNGNIVCFRAPSPDPASNGSFTDVIGVVVTKLTSQSAQSLTLSQLVSSGLTGLSKAMANFQLLSNANESIQHIPAKLVTASFDENNQSITIESLSILSGNVFYTINAQCLTASWPSQQSTIQNSLLSFAP